jgi:hypothetical protein
MIIGIAVALHTTISILTGLDKKYMVIFTPALLLAIGAILIEHSKLPGNHS